MVPHRSTNLARQCLTSLSRREAVLSLWYGRSWLIVALLLYELALLPSSSRKRENVETIQSGSTFSLSKPGLKSRSNFHRSTFSPKSRSNFHRSHSQIPLLTTFHRSNSQIPLLTTFTLSNPAPTFTVPRSHSNPATYNFHKSRSNFHRSDSQIPLQLLHSQIPLQLAPFKLSKTGPTFTVHTLKTGPRFHVLTLKSRYLHRSIFSLSKPVLTHGSELQKPVQHSPNTEHHQVKGS